MSALDAAYAGQVCRLRDGLLSVIDRTWAGLPAYRDGDATQFISSTARRVEAVQQEVANLTGAYFGRSARVSVPRFTASTEALRHISTAVLLNRAFVEVRTVLSKGGSFQAAQKAGRSRLLSVVGTNLQLAKTHAARAAMVETGARFYERTLTGRENCALCVIASTQRYRRGDLMPIHPGCDCHVRPLSKDPGRQVINRERLEEIHAAVESHFGGSDRGARVIDGLSDRSDYLDLIAVRDHGEIGPVLTWRYQRFTAAADL